MNKKTGVSLHQLFLSMPSFRPTDPAMLDAYYAWKKAVEVFEDNAHAEIEIQDLTTLEVHVCSPQPWGWQKMIR